MTKSPSYYNLLEAFSESGCAICRLLEADAHQFIDSLLYEYSNDRDIHVRIRRMRGLCNNHSWQMTAYHGRTSNIAVLQQAVIDELITILEQNPVEAGNSSNKGLFGNGQDRKRGHQLAESLQPSESCFCCTTLNAKEETYCAAIGEFMPERTFEESYRGSDGLCLKHFSQTIRAVNRAEHLRLLVDIQTERWSTLKDELETFRVNATSRRTESFGDEKDSWRRAIAATAGAKDVFGSER